MTSVEPGSNRAHQPCNLQIQRRYVPNTKARPQNRLKKRWISCSLDRACLRSSTEKKPLWFQSVSAAFVSSAPQRVFLRLRSSIYCQRTCMSGSQPLRPSARAQQRVELWRCRVRLEKSHKTQIKSEWVYNNLPRISE